MTLSILYLIETLGHGGAEHQLVETIKLLDRERFRATVCHFRAPGYLAKELQNHGIRVDCLDIPRGQRHWPKLALRIRQLARDVRADLIHTSLMEADIVGGVAGKLARVPVVSTLCNVAGERVRLIDNPRNNSLKLAASNLLWSSALRHLHQHSIAISRAVRDSTVSTFHVDESRISVIYRGIEASRPVCGDDQLDLRRRLGFGDAAPLLLNIGRLGPQKGQRYLVEALAQVVREFPRAKLAIVGVGWLEQALRAEASARGLSENVVFLGKRTDVPELLAACDMFVFPSLFEGLGVSLLEASYAGCACISTNTGPIPEIIAHEVSGLLVPPADADALAAAILRLARDPQLSRQLGGAARSKALAEFMLSDKVVQLQELYSRLLPATRT